MLRKGSLEKVRKKNWTKAIRLQLLDLSENCHSSAHKSTEKERKKRGKNASIKNMAPNAEKSGKQEKV